MAGFDRSKLKATPMKVLKEQEEEYTKVRPSSGGGQSEFLVHKIDEGRNVFRFFPPHPDGGGSSFGESRCVSYLTVRRPKRDETTKKIIEGEFEDKSFPIFNAKVHGGLKKDPVEEYMKFAKDVAIPVFVDQDTEKGERIWEEIVGKYSPVPANRLQGIKPSDSTEVYAVKLQKDGSWSKVGRLAFAKSVKQQLMDVAIEFSSGDDTTPDPFTDPDEGIAVIIENSGSGFDRYKVSLDTVKKKVEGLKQEVPVPVPTPLTDEQIEEWLKLEPLYKMYVKSYKRSDFNMQLEGLQNFDAYLAKKKFPIQVFGYDGFLDIIASIEAQLPQEEEKNEDDDLPFEADPPKPREVEKPTPTVSRAAGRVTTTTTPSQTTPTTSGRSKLDELKAKYKK